MSSNVARSLGEVINRRRFLRRIAVAATSLAASLLGLPQTALALFNCACCTLCQPCGTSCSGCHCVWCWNCTDGSGQVWLCCECYDISGDCLGDCNHVTCSYYKKRNVLRPQAAH